MWYSRLVHTRTCVKQGAIHYAFRRARQRNSAVERLLGRSAQSRQAVYTCTQTKGEETKTQTHGLEQAQSRAEQGIVPCSKRSWLDTSGAIAAKWRPSQDDQSPRKRTQGRNVYSSTARRNDQEASRRAQHSPYLDRPRPHILIITLACSRQRQLLKPCDTLAHLFTVVSRALRFPRPHTDLLNSLNISVSVSRRLPLQSFPKTSIIAPGRVCPVSAGALHGGFLLPKKIRPAAYMPWPFLLLERSVNAS